MACVRDEVERVLRIDKRISWTNDHPIDFEASTGLALKYLWKILAHFAPPKTFPCSRMRFGDDVHGDRCICCLAFYSLRHCRLTLGHSHDYLQGVLNKAPGQRKPPPTTPHSIVLQQDLVTGDEIISDSYKLIDVDDVVYEIDCKKITKGGVSVDIGANPSAEGEDAEALEEGAEQVIDVVESFRLVSMPFGDKKSFTGQFKGMVCNKGHGKQG